jgi:phosphate starvation-inducible protein PhoH
VPRTTTRGCYHRLGGTIPPVTATRKIDLPEQGADTLFGPLDENLKLLEAQFNVQIRTSQKEVIVEGDAADVGRAARVVGQQTSLIVEG